MMSSNETETVVYGVPGTRGGFYGGNGGSDVSGTGNWCMILLVVVVLWLLFAKGGHADGRGDGYGGHDSMTNILGGFGGFSGLNAFGGNNCAYDCKPKMVMDMSNCEVDKDLWKVDADLWKANCETQKVVVDGDRAILDKLCANETQALRDKLAEAYSEKAALESKFFTEKKFDQIESLIYKMDNQNDKQINCLAGMIKDLSCGLPKLPPVYCEGITPNTHHTDCHDFPRRNNCNDCGCNGSY